MLSRGLFLKDWIGRGKGNGKGEKGRRAACPNNKKIVPTPLASKHQCGGPVKVLQTSWPLMGFAIRQTQSSRKFQSQDQSAKTRCPFNNIFHQMILMTILLTNVITL